MTAEGQPRVSNQFPGTTYGPVVQAGHIKSLMLSAPPATPAAALPSSMRGDLPDFTGREDDLRRLFAVITSTVDAPTRAVVVHAVDGMPGVGKTAFCVHAAHQ